MKKEKLYIIIPAYNEEENIENVGQCVGQDVVHNKTDIIVLPKKDNVVPSENENYIKLMSNFDILMEMIDKYKKMSALCGYKAGVILS